MNKLDYSPKGLNCSSKIQLSEVFLKESCFLKFRNIHGKKPVLESLKVACFQTCSVIKKRLQHRCFHVNFAKFVRIPFLQNTSGRLFLKYMNISQSDIATSPSGAFRDCENVAFFMKLTSSQGLLILSYIVSTKCWDLYFHWVSLVNVFFKLLLSSEITGILT